MSTIDLNPVARSVARSGKRLGDEVAIEQYDWADGTVEVYADGRGDTSVSGAWILADNSVDTGEWC